ncbi:3-hydroxyisobutyrate dehydrogenase-like beta-hydroxyacid dehydrogenase [Nonomuraea polychroma]|uniref:3-hydroxyisobutyrate dehydrogenase-like beta-hydroxyacid dehydrogenase n=1 Tax=Nonomuraea polychroma TaxID=46176 RepID=A0A438M9S4_9ACTN|nr:NAD(P)-binding domain-containing protein [Nonomuraea polychroma]RVX42446.1 3-hydroxyisobutyrate dehydrogenase-like beta-hydroxyacid dehydrogenase [Nonomuraea polychroma]
MIAFLGQGRMGVPMARRLVAAGHEVTTWRRGTGVPAAAAVEGADLVITMLSDPAAVREVLTAALPGLRPGATVVEMSTIGPEAVRELRALLPPSVNLVDAPVLGSVGPAAEGTLTVLAGGDLSGCREVLPVFGSVRELGPLGAGAAMKIAVMSAMVPAQVLLAETYAYAQAHGVDREALIDVLSGTPLGVLAERLRVPSEETRYSLAHAAKDLELGAWERGSLATAARKRLQEARAAGFGDRDVTAIVEHVEGGRASRAVPVTVPAIPATNGMYSHAVRVGDMLYVSGVAAFDESGKVAGEGSMAAQAEHVFQVIARILADQGAAFGDIAFIRTYLTDMDARAEYGAVRRRYITGTPPASTTVEVSRLFMPGLLLEVDLIVALTPAGR